MVGWRRSNRVLRDDQWDKRSAVKALVSTAGILKAEDYPEFKDQASINEWVRAQRRTEEAS